MARIQSKAGDQSTSPPSGTFTKGSRAERGLDFELDRRWVLLEEPIKLLGTFSVPIRLHTEVEVEVEVQVIEEEVDS